ncbi:hypothetical protein BJX70DRAFT_361910 [Aspergillus crustosus]
MALISPTNLLTLHYASEHQIRSLQISKSGRYRYLNSHSSVKSLTIPSPELFSPLPKTKEGPGGITTLPTIAECAIHLEMLEVFQALRDEVLQSRGLDDTFNIHPAPKTVYRKRWVNRKYVLETASIKDVTFDERRKAKWKYYLQIATERFGQWIRVVNGYLERATSEAGVVTPEWLLLPPLDVLVIWHAFLLNCDDFEEYCNKNKLAHVQNIEFPWAQIHAAIDSDIWKYTLSDDHSSWLLNTNAIHPDLFSTLSAAPKEGGLIRSLLSTFDDYGLVMGPKTSLSPLFEIIRLTRQNRSTNKYIVENVERQCVFVDKMHAHRWLRSPAAQGTLRRAVDRYDKFLHLFRMYPNQFLVPTLDVDLAWHTHQCSAARYREFVTERVGRFINHEDKIGRGTLNDGFTNAEQWYRLRFGEQYQVCLCWSCEAVLSAVEELDEEELDEVHPDPGGVVKEVDSKVHYYRAVEISRKLGG